MQPSILIPGPVPTTSEECILSFPFRNGPHVCIFISSPESGGHRNHTSVPFPYRGKKCVPGCGRVCADNLGFQGQLSRGCWAAPHIHGVRGTSQVDPTKPLTHSGPDGAASRAVGLGGKHGQGGSSPLRFWTWSLRGTFLEGSSHIWLGNLRGSGFVDCG